jgi:phosphohistidine phosphatase
MELYFLRHGDAVTGESWKGKDGERPLSASGAALMEREAAAIARLCPRVDVILCSPLLRARQTAEMVVRRLGRHELLEVEKRLSPGFGVDELAAILRERHSAGALMLVGHEPDFGRVISACIGGGSVEVKKGSLLRVDLEKTSSLTGVLAWNLPAGVLAPDS